MLGDQVSSDLKLDEIHSAIKFATKWGSEEFSRGLSECTGNANEIKRRQLPLLALRVLPETSNNLLSLLSEQRDRCECIDDMLNTTDSRIAESVSQVFWTPSSFSSFLNSRSWIMNSMITWKTLILPGSALLMPILAFFLPFIILRMRDQQMSSSEYLARLKEVILKQISVPSFLKAKHENDRIGFLLESLFIGITLAIFISSLWNQINAAMHLRNIVADLRTRGTALHESVVTAKGILKTLNALPLRRKLAFRHILARGETAVEKCERLAGLEGLATFGAVWNSNTGVTELRGFLGYVDAILSISQLRGICFSRVNGRGLELRGVTHPALTPCVSNNLSCSSRGHAILTGPNRGGKSTFCRATGLAVVTAQSWGFAWAEQMSFTPFARILTALEPGGRLGALSTFEAEIEFAKNVLAAEGRCFVMMDEIFHSTNATDGVAASKVFMERLYERTDVVSLISTHYKDLAVAFGEVAQPLMMVATDRDDGCLDYTYTVAQGVSEKSSVMEILYERGLLRAVPCLAVPCLAAPRS